MVNKWKEWEYAIKMQNLNYKLDVALPLSGMNMVLGAEWLMQLGTYVTNFQEHFMELYGLGILHHKVTITQSREHKGFKESLPTYRGNWEEMS